ncbi:CopG family transcriptional regulator [Candidatus Bathyarchaeota archaeon]|nr:MAG: CopG family transcriptional regulator [Candidatus Bathyarchaeota archaeon]
METKKIEIPAELYEKIEKRAKETGFGNVDKYVTFVLEELLRELESEEEEEYELSEEEEEKIKERLRALGYID